MCCISGEQLCGLDDSHGFLEPLKLHLCSWEPSKGRCLLFWKLYLKVPGSSMIPWKLAWNSRPISNSLPILSYYANFSLNYMHILIHIIQGKQRNKPWQAEKRNSVCWLNQKGQLCGCERCSHSNLNTLENPLTSPILNFFFFKSV